MGYTIKTIYAVTFYKSIAEGHDENKIYEVSEWYSDPQTLIAEIDAKEDVSVDEYVEKENTNKKYAYLSRKILKRFGIYLDNRLVKICKTKDNANEVLKKFGALEKKLNDMSGGEEIFLDHHDNYKGFSNRYSEEELEILYAKDPLLRPFNLDYIIQNFLEEHDIFLKPSYDYKNPNQSKTQEWAGWKQWALNHQDFQSFKNESYPYGVYEFREYVEIRNKEIEEQFNNPEFIRKFDAWIRLAKSKRKK